MSINKGLMTSATDLWATPQEFFDQQNALYGPFTVDVCADATNAKCPVYFDKTTDPHFHLPLSFLVEAAHGIKGEA